MRKYIFFVIVVVLAVLGGMWGGSKSNLFSWENKNIPWYAVYLTNNQVYFGHIVSIKKDLVILKDVHFAESYQEPAQISTSGNFALEQTPKQTFRIVQRGNEKMLSSDGKLFINRTSVLYWEKFSSDAEVVKLLEESK